MSRAMDGKRAGNLSSECPVHGQGLLDVGERETLVGVGLSNIKLDTVEGDDGMPLHSCSPVGGNVQRSLANTLGHFVLRRVDRNGEAEETGTQRPMSRHHQ